MATRPEVRTRSLSLEVERRKIERRKEQREAQAHLLNIKNHDLEKSKIIVDVLKHVATVITALLFILSYFGDRVIPGLREAIIFGLSPWDLAIIGISLSLSWSLAALTMIASDPIWPSRSLVLQPMLLVLIFSLVIAALVIIISLAKMP
jgi:hypothetical protein